MTNHEVLNPSRRGVVKQCPWPGVVSGWRVHVIGINGAVMEKPDALIRHQPNIAYDATILAKVFLSFRSDIHNPDGCRAGISSIVTPSLYQSNGG
jgi:hypothetical protein